MQKKTNTNSRPEYPLMYTRRKNIGNGKPKHRIKKAFERKIHGSFNKYLASPQDETSITKKFQYQVVHFFLLAYCQIFSQFSSIDLL